ncbi:nuclear pore complex protein DDB_G0274915 isoform X2 [Monomorium pharaonis]|uniref:nuclear pore complex protein DDB_G0274915 isoform X2 n=1 Tax=Monomorium pharaonis TaxID=307658 RepID=UPI00063F7A30|nr:nuclear pore complex protein DDB_G0274915 isoform X2 [Monomorium pharaonis]
MVICKYYRQGNCRYGQYCQFEHINHFGNTKTEDDIVILVAKEVLLAERGGQWLLSCFAPLKERPCIPGMEDLSPEEVRWEIYEAQKNGMVEQAKLHFQQLCQDMKARREVLKNPTREIITLLKKLLGSQKASQLSLLNMPTNVFGTIPKFTMPNNNPFGGGGGGFFSSNNASIFGKSNNTTSVFGGTTTFGNNLGGFSGAATSGAGSIFGTTSTSTSFSGTQNSAPTFGTPQSNAIFGGSSQSVFGQNNVFATSQLSSNASTTSLFNSPITSQTNSVFGGGGVPTTSSSGSFNNGIFTQPKTQMPAFGGAPVFAGVPSNYNNNSAGNSIFGGGQTFGAATSGSIFGGSSAATATPTFSAVAATTAPAFGTSVVATTTPSFGSVATTPAPTFDLTQQPSNNTTFGTTVSTPNVFATQNINTISVGNTPFSPFVTNSSQQFDSTSNTNSTRFAGTEFGAVIASTNNTFSTSETSNSIFANAGTTFAITNATIPNSSPFSASTFGNTNASSSPFGSATSTTVTTTTINTNPFVPRTQQGSSPFGNAVQNQHNASPFEKSPFNATNTVVDDSVYSMDGDLTDDEKNMFLAEKFIIGKIPLKPPTKDIR